MSFAVPLPFPTASDVVSDSAQAAGGYARAQTDDEQARTLAAIAGHIKDMHEGIAKRVWSAVGPMAVPVRIAHDRIATRTYEAARGLTRALVKAGANVASNVRPPDSPSIERAIPSVPEIRPASPRQPDVAEASRSIAPEQSSLPKPELAGRNDLRNRQRESEFNRPYLEPEPAASRDQQFQIIGVLNRLYVLMESSDGLVLVDQHARHLPRH